MPIDTNKGPGGVDASYGKRSTTSSFDRTKSYDNGVYLNSEGELVGPGGQVVSSGGVFTKNATTGFAETTVGAETFLALPKAGNNARANINVRTGTFAALSTLVGGDGEIAKCTDQEALFAYDGVTPGGIIFRGDSAKGLIFASFASDEASSAGNAVNMSIDIFQTPLARGTLVAPNAEGVFTLNSSSGWVKITGFVSHSQDALSGASHKITLLYSYSLAGPYSEAMDFDLPPLLAQTPMNLVFTPTVFVGAPLYFRFAFKNTSTADVIASANVCIEHLA